jgi:uncharacterized RDD family membrane protein YckC
MKYASFWARFLAALLDAVIINILSFFVGAVIGFTFPASTGSTTGLEALGFLIGIVVGWLYFALSESSPKQATLGKQALKIVVIDLNGSQISFGQATVRYFAKYVLGIITLLIGYLMAAFTKKNQALHDIVAGTLVGKQ